MAHWKNCTRNDCSVCFLLKPNPYASKAKELHKYIEPLRKLIVKIGYEDHQELKKLSKLMIVLRDPFIYNAKKRTTSGRISYDVLLQCESTLKKMIGDIPKESEQHNKTLLYVYSHIIT